MLCSFDVPTKSVQIVMETSQVLCWILDKVFFSRFFSLKTIKSLRHRGQNILRMSIILEGFSFSPHNNRYTDSQENNFFPELYSCVFIKVNHQHLIHSKRFNASIFISSDSFHFYRAKPIAAIRLRVGHNSILIPQRCSLDFCFLAWISRFCACIMCMVLKWSRINS